MGLAQAWVVAMALATLPGGVVAPQEGWREGVTAIGDDGVVQQAVTTPDGFTSHVTSQLPPDDRGKWYITIFTTPNSGDSQLLLRDLRQSPALRALAAWGTLQVIDYSTLANKERWKSQRVRYTPTILVYPRPGHPRLGYKYVVAQEGYGGDADKLARNIFTAIRRIYQKEGAGGPCPGPYCPQPNQPNQPYQPDSPWRPGPPNDGDWPAPAPIPNGWDDGGGFNINLGFDWLWSAIGFAFQIVVLLVAVMIGLTLLPKVLGFTFRKLKEAGNEITGTPAGTGAAKPDGGGPAASGTAADPGPPAGS